MIHLPGIVWWREIYDMPLGLFDVAKSYVETKMGR
jgi:hypothetical protein